MRTRSTAGSRVHAGRGRGASGAPLKDADAARLIKALDHYDSAVRGGAARVIGRLQVKSAADGLLKAVNDSNEQVRFASIRALGEIGEVSAVPAITEQLNYYGKGTGAAAALGALRPDREPVERAGVPVPSRGQGSSASPRRDRRAGPRGRQGVGRDLRAGGQPGRRRSQCAPPWRTRSTRKAMSTISRRLIDLDGLGQNGRAGPGLSPRAGTAGRPARDPAPAGAGRRRARSIWQPCSARSAISRPWRRSRRSKTIETRTWRRPPRTRSSASR